MRPQVRDKRTSVKSVRKVIYASLSQNKAIYLTQEFKQIFQVIFANDCDGTDRRFIESVSEEAFKDNNGLKSYFILMTVFNFVKDYIVITPTSSLGKFQQFAMTLMKLRLSLLNKTWSIKPRFGISI